MSFKIADYEFKFNLNYHIDEELSEKYSDSAEGIDCEFDIYEEDIKYEELVAEEKSTREYSASIACLRKIAEWLPLHNAFVLHSATFDVDGIGVAFAAHSGTGKSTHMLLWQNLLGDRMTIVNGDKPIVRFFDDEPNTPYAYGTPWNGKERLGCNMRTPLKHICFIERATKNSVEAMEPGEAIDRIFNQVYMPKNNPIATMKTMELINKLITSCKLWKINCNMEPEAAEIAYKAIFNSES